MTNIEATSRIRAILERTQRPDYMCIDRQSLADREALNLAIEALEKQIPKIVRIEQEHHKYRHVFLCPNCNRMDVGDVGKWHYCPICGQALKMEDET